MKMGAIDSKPPHESATYRVTKDVILQGLEELADLLDTLRECEKTDTWPPANEQETDLMIPAWALAEETSLEEFEEVEQ